MSADLSFNRPTKKKDTHIGDQSDQVDSRVLVPCVLPLGVDAGVWFGLAVEEGHGWRKWKREPGRREAIGF